MEEDTGAEEEPKGRTTRARTGAAKAGPSRSADDGWQKVEGAGRCVACAKDGVPCPVNLAAIDKWRVAFREGTVFKKNPPHTSCRRCLDKKKGCDLPATREMRKGLQGATPKATRATTKAESPAASAATSGRKRRLLMEVEVPSRKRMRAASPEMTDEGFRKGLLKVLGEIEGHLGKLAAASDRWVAAGADRKGKRKAEEWEHDAEEVEIEDRSSFVEGSGQAWGSGRSEEFEEESGVAEQMVKDL